MLIIWLLVLSYGTATFVTDFHSTDPSLTKPLSFMEPKTPIKETYGVIPSRATFLLNLTVNSLPYALIIDTGSSDLVVKG